ncbi:MAG: PHP domain-containing protein [Lentisphaeria bacterium]|nr:PHP domain-containing protein [Lentisphaeria bacterium]
MHITSDIHLHSNLSSCAKPESTPAALLKACRDQGIRTVGFADHLWDKAMPGASKWYQPQDVEHVLSIKQALVSEECQELSRGLKVLVGCETEFLGGKQVGISREAASLFDFILIPPDHFHMKNYVFPADMTDPEGIKTIMIRRFMEVMALGLATAVVHPFHAMGFTPEMPTLVQSLISDNEYRECFTAAKQARCAIELNSCVARRHDAGTGEDNFSPEYIRMMTIARECGCTFSIGSDAHSPELIIGGVHKRLERFADACGITDILQL